MKNNQLLRTHQFYNNASQKIELTIMYNPTINPFTPYTYTYLTRQLNCAWKD